MVLSTTTNSPESFNATHYLVSRQLAEGRGGHPAVVAPERSLTYAELDGELRQVAAGLRALGVRAEDRVVLCMADGPELFTAILAAMHIGAVAVPVSTMLTASELRTLIADSRSRIVLCSAEFGQAVAEAVAGAPEVRHLVQFPHAPATAGVDAHGWPELLAHGHAEAYDTWPDSQALWLYTSGTTGKPKAAMHRHADIRLVTETYGQQVLGITAEDRCLSVAKLFFAYGIGNSMFFPLSVGATAVLEPGRPSPQLFAERAQRDQVTLLFGTPSFWAPLLSADVPEKSFSSVRQGVSAGEMLPARLFHGVLERFGFEVLDGIGSTEMLHIYLSNRAGQVRPGSSGVPVPGYEVEIRDPGGIVIDEVETPGELYVQGASAATGYWCRADISRQVFLGKWTRTGDTYQRNTDGTYTFLGRSGDMLKVGGIWVAPTEVEERLLAHPGVSEAVVVGIADTDGLDKPIACVVPTPGTVLDDAELIAWCRQELASFKRPRAVVQLDAFPRTATGKIRRNVLRDELRASLPIRLETAG